MTNTEEYAENYKKIRELKTLAVEKLGQKKAEDLNHLQKQKQEYKSDIDALTLIYQREEELGKYYRNEERKLAKLFDELAFIIL